MLSEEELQELLGQKEKPEEEGTDWKRGVGLGLAALGDAISAYGGNKGGNFNRILDTERQDKAIEAAQVKAQKEALVNEYMLDKRLDSAKQLQQDRFAQQDKTKEADRKARLMLEQMKQRDKLNKQSQADRKFELEKTKASRVSDKTRDSLLDMQEGIDRLRNIREGFHKGDNQFVGVLENAIPDWAAGGDRAAFRANIQNFANSYIKELTGAQMSEPEAQRLMRALPRTPTN